MKLIAELEDGVKLEIMNLKGLDANSKLIIMKSSSLLRPVEVEKLENELTIKLGIKVVLLPPYIGEVLSI